MTDDTAQIEPVPAESPPASEGAAPTPTEPASPSPESTSGIEQSASANEPSVIPEESQCAQEIPKDSRPMSQSTSTSQMSQTQAHHWSNQDRAKSAATKTRKKDAYLAKIVDYAKAHNGQITNDDIEKLLHVSDATASRYAKVLVSRGLLRAEGKGRGAKYFLP